MGPRAPETSAETKRHTPKWSRGGYVIKHSTRSGIFGFSEASRAKAWEDAAGNGETRSDLGILEHAADTVRIGDWYVGFVGCCTELEFCGESPASRRLQAVVRTKNTAEAEVAP